MQEDQNPYLKSYALQQKQQEQQQQQEYTTALSATFYQPPQQSDRDWVADFFFPFPPSTMTPSTMTPFNTTTTRSEPHAKNLSVERL
jgi:hypothetical protein